MGEENKPKKRRADYGEPFHCTSASTPSHVMRRGRRRVREDGVIERDAGGRMPVGGMAKMRDSDVGLLKRVHGASRVAIPSPSPFPSPSSFLWRALAMRV